MPPYGIRFSQDKQDVEAPPPTVGKVRTRNVRTNSVGGGAHDAPQVSLQCSHKSKAPLCKGSWRASA